MWLLIGLALSGVRADYFRLYSYWHDECSRLELPASSLFGADLFKDLDLQTPNPPFHWFLAESLDRLSGSGEISTRLLRPDSSLG